MALVYADQAALAASSTFVDKIKMALVLYSLDVPDEDVGGEGEPTEAEHALRLVLARKIIENPSSAEIWVYALVADGTLTSESTDANIDTQIGLLFTTIASL